MQKVLSLLVAFVFLHTQAHALSGGPRFDSSTNLIGTYSGVMSGPPDALGIFVLGIPDVGIAKGVFIAFATGSYYQGSIQGIADPQESTLRAIVQAERRSTLFEVTGDFDFSVTQADARCDGFLNAEIKETGDVAFGLASTRLEGDAQLDIKELETSNETDANGNIVQTSRFVPAGSIQFTVDGFKQTNDAAAGTGATIEQTTTAGG